MFHEAPKQVSFPALEARVLEFWKERDIYGKSLEARRGAPRFVFYEGPPTANGLPHPGHCLTRAIKDLFPRYRTMRGYFCERKAGWDTHGLPVEVEVCKELGIHSKEEIEAFGVEPFIHKCQQSVWRYMRDWERLTERLGFWVNLQDAYVTYHQSYVESVWWSLKCLFERGLLYQGHKIVWWWAQGGTALSSGEVGQGYREVADPSVFVRFPLVDQPEVSLLVWTTTPWTLPSNQFAAVHPEVDYAQIRNEESGQQLVMASDLVESICHKTKQPWRVESTVKGAQLVGRRYIPPFSFFYRQHDHLGKLKSGGEAYRAWRVLPAEFVTTDSGSGIVHQAPAFGEVDYDLLLREQDRFADGEGPELICAVAPDGRFKADIPDYAGLWVKDADRAIVKALRAQGLLVHQEQYLHEYPFCWRSEEDPLIQYPRRSWFVRTTQFKEQMLANNARIRWLPEHIRDGRFGNFLASNVDWALSRERYWGTPLPIWQCEQTGYQEAVGSYAELLSKPDVRGQEVWEQAKVAHPELPDDLRVHKPYIDAVTYAAPPQAGAAAGARMRRVSEVIDCWYDSGAMPFAQWGYPHQNAARFWEQFPADFISEAIDQTRGWFYSLLAISTLLFDESSHVAAPHPAASDAAQEFPHPFRTCIVLGLMLSEWFEGKSGQLYLSEEEARAEDAAVRQIVGKMSKSKRNYREPQEIFDRYGADSLRWYFFANQAPWTSIRYSERAIKDSVSEFQLRLWNVYSFFLIYANIDQFDPAASITGEVGHLEPHQLARAASYRAVPLRAELDRWVLAELWRTVDDVVQRMDAYDSYGACAKLSDFVDALSNWYVRRSRDRYWAAEKNSADKRDAYWTLYECLITVTKMLAPFMPFLAEAMWGNLAGVFGGRASESVHLCDFPQADPRRADPLLSAQMQLAREISSLGRAARMQANLKVRQPLAKVEVILADNQHLDWLEAHKSLIADELNVLQVDFTQDADQYIRYEIKPNFKLLGPLLGKEMPTVKALLSRSDGAHLRETLVQHGSIQLELPSGRCVELTAEHVEIGIAAKPGWTAAQGRGCVVVLSTDVNPELLRLGLVKDLIRSVQVIRKEMDLAYTDRIRIGVYADGEELCLALRHHAATIQQETLADELSVDRPPGPAGVAVEVELGGVRAELIVTRATS